MNLAKIHITQKIVWEEGVINVGNRFFSIPSQRLLTIKSDDVFKSCELGLILFEQSQKDSSFICAKVWNERDTKKALFEIESCKSVGKEEYEVKGCIYVPEEYTTSKEKIKETLNAVKFVFYIPEGTIFIPKAYLETSAFFEEKNVFDDDIVFENIESELYVIECFNKQSPAAQEVIKTVGFGDLEMEFEEDKEDKEDVETE